MSLAELDDANWLPRPPKDECFRCKKPGEAFQRCSRCRTVPYCSRDCQTADWKDHKKSCMVFVSQNAADATSTVLGQKGHLKNGREHLRNRAEIIRDLTATATEHNDTYNVVIWHAMDLVRDIGRAKTHFFAMTLTRNHEATNPRAWYSFVDAAVLPLSLLEEKFDNVATMTANEDGSTTETPWSPLAVLKTHDEEMIRKGGALGAALIVAVELSKKEKSKTVAQAVKETSCPGISPMGLWISVKRSVSVLPPVMSNPRIWKACLKNAMDGYAYTMKRTPMPKQA